MMSIFTNHCCYEALHSSSRQSDVRVARKFYFFCNWSHLRLPCTFRGVSSLTDVADAPYIADIVTPYQIKVYKICYKEIAILFDSNESGIFLRPITRTLWSPFTNFNSKWFLFFNNPILSRESRYKALLYSIPVKSYAMFCKSTQRNPE